MHHTECPPLREMGVDKDGRTVLHLAVEGGSVAVVQCILETAQVDVNAVDGTRSFTPLHLAVYGGCQSIAELLLKRHANINQVDRVGQTALECAA